MNRVVIDKSRADILREGHSEALSHFIEKCPSISRLLRGAKRVTEGVYGDIRIRKDYSYANTRFWAPGIALIGDAACFVDPVFSSGVHLATYSGLLVARSVNTCITGDIDEESAFDEFERRYRREFSHFYDFLLAFYNLDQDLPSYYWDAKKITNAPQPEDQAFINLVGGVSGNDILPSDFVDARRDLAESLFGRISRGEDGLQLGSKNGAFYRDLTSEITQVQLQAMLGDKRGPERPLFEAGLVPSNDGVHWSP